MIKIIMKKKDVKDQIDQIKKVLNYSQRLHLRAVNNFRKFRDYCIVEYISCVIP